MQLILASSSPRRLELLQKFTTDFSVIPSDFEEQSTEKDPVRLVSLFAEGKARSVALTHPDSVVIGADTVVFCLNKILGKPKNETEAREMLQLLSGKRHTVFTGVCVRFGDRVSTNVCRTDVYFKKLSSALIEKYILSREPYDKAGGYGIQGRGVILVDRIEGDYSNVVGLPVGLLYQMLLEFDIDLLRGN